MVGEILNNVEFYGRWGESRWPSNVVRSWGGLCSAVDSCRLMMMITVDNNDRVVGHQGTYTLFIIPLKWQQGIWKLVLWHHHVLNTFLSLWECWSYSGRIELLSHYLPSIPVVVWIRRIRSEDVSWCLGKYQKI